MAAYSLGTMSAWAVTSNTDQIISGAKTFRAAAAAVTPLTITGAASQTANLLEVRSSTGAILTAISSAGGIRALDISNPADSGPYISFVSNAMVVNNRGAVTNVPLIVKGMAGQTGGLIEWQNSAGTVLARVRSSGNVGIGHPGADSTSLTVQARTATDRALQVYGWAGQTGNLAEFGDSAGTIRTHIKSSGAIEVAATTSGQHQLLLRGQTTGDAVLGVRGAPGQTASLAEFQNSAGTVVASVTPSGGIGILPNRAPTDLPSTWPEGFTCHGAAATSGWPSWGVVQTIKSGGDVAQIWWGVTSDDRRHRRAASGTDAWTAWIAF